MSTNTPEVEIRDTSPLAVIFKPTWAKIQELLNQQPPITDNEIPLVDKLMNDMLKQLDNEENYVTNEAMCTKHFNSRHIIETWCLYAENNRKTRKIFLYAIRHIILLKHHPFLFENIDPLIHLIEHLNNENLDEETLSRYLLLIYGICQVFVSQPANIKDFMKDNNLCFYDKIVKDFTTVSKNTVQQIITEIFQTILSIASEDIFNFLNEKHFEDLIINEFLLKYKEAASPLINETDISFHYQLNNIIMLLESLENNFISNNQMILSLKNNILNLIKTKFISEIFTNKLLKGSENEICRILSHLSQIIEYCYVNHPNSILTNLFINYVINDECCNNDNNLTISWLIMNKLYSVSSNIIVYTLSLYDTLFSLKITKVLNYLIYDYIKDQSYRKSSKESPSMLPFADLSPSKRIENKLSEYNNIFPESPKPTVKYIDESQKNVISNCELPDIEAESVLFTFDESNNDLFKTPTKQQQQQQHTNENSENEKQFVEGPFLTAIYTLLESFYNNTQEVNLNITGLFVTLLQYGDFIMNDYFFNFEYEKEYKHNTRCFLSIISKLWNEGLNYISNTSNTHQTLEYTRILLDTYENDDNSEKGNKNKKSIMLENVYNNEYEEQFFKSYVVLEEYLKEISAYVYAKEWRDTILFQAQS